MPRAQKPAYKPVASQVSWPEMEAETLRYWAAERIFERSLEQRAGCPEWVFYEGPPTANNKPGIHHVEARTFKDLFCRYQTMKGRYVHRKAGWDCHGLPVEIEVEKELGITQKREIEERIGVEEFVNRCRQSVQRYVDDWERLTERIGFWLDLDDAYWTMTPQYIETVWWVLKLIWDKGLLQEDFKVVPYCPRCETALSSHEQHQTGAYSTVEDPSVFVRFPLTMPGAEGDSDTSMVAWTTTPWTLLANLAVAVNPSMTYAVVPDPQLDGHKLVVAEERVAAVLGDETPILERIPGRDLVGRDYRPPFDFVPSEGSAHSVRPGDFVTAEDGTGIVHLAPYGETDMEVAKRDGLPIVQMINASGRVAERGGKFAGLWIKDADGWIIEDLKDRSLLLRSEIYEHSYPHCWRCQTPLLYYARKDWYIRTSQIRTALQASNEATNWQPPTIKYGRFGDWLANNVDWSLSRDRYWGTPLPIWRCPREHAVCVGSFAELSELAGYDVSTIDPHRPFVDAITFPCPECGDESQRVKSVIDAWFDSGAMPFGQWHYPFENEANLESRFPADFISEAIDQTRGWFYSLLAIATLVRGENSYKNVVCLGHIVDTRGRKMSKSLGNVIDPWVVLDGQGADALRWYLLTGGTPWSPRRLSVEIVQESLRKYLLTLWNTYSFWVTYASLEEFDPTAESIPASERPEIDRWILAELDDTVRVVGEGLERFDATRGGRRLDALVDDLSNWYVRRSRRRFWKSGEDADTRSAFLTLWECLVTIAKLSAPFTPFVAEQIFRNLTVPDDSAPPSVHLADWPAPDDALVDDELRSSMSVVRRLVGLGRAARTEGKARVRQPLARALLVLPAAEAGRLRNLEDLIAEELNVKDVEIVRGLEELVSYSIKPNFKMLGPRFGARVKDVARALASVDAHALVAEIEATGRATLTVDGEAVTLEREDLDVRVEGREGFSLAQEAHYGVALDLNLTPALVAEGIAREVVRGIQDLRKESGLAVEDRIELWMESTDPEIARALDSYSDFIREEVLASGAQNGEVEDDAFSDVIELGNGTARVALRPV